MAELQTIRVAPITSSSFRRYVALFPLSWVAAPAELLLFGLGGAKLFFPSLMMPWGIAALLIGAGCVLPVLMACAIFWSRKTVIVIDDTRLVVRGATNGPSVLLASLALQQARAVDLSIERKLIPASGVAINLPGMYWAGTGTLKNDARAMWLITDPAAVVYVPARNGYSVLVSAADSNGLVGALHARASRAQTGTSADFLEAASG